MIGMPDRGTIARGAIGDFLIYNGDLEKGELELSKVTTVAKGGVIFVDRGRWVGP
jgi:imidazolonepropionase-like amidohydrolase